MKSRLSPSDTGLKPRLPYINYQNVYLDNTMLVPKIEYVSKERMFFDDSFNQSFIKEPK